MSLLSDLVTEIPSDLTFRNRFEINTLECCCCNEEHKLQSSYQGNPVDSIDSASAKKGLNPGRTESKCEGFASTPCVCVLVFFPFFASFLQKQLKQSEYVSTISLS